MNILFFNDFKKMKKLTKIILYLKLNKGKKENLTNKNKKIPKNNGLLGKNNYNNLFSNLS